jgi:hypothetical protein
MNQSLKNLQNPLLILIVIVIIALSVHILFLAKRTQLLRIDLAEVNHIRYSMLNVDEWSDQVGQIIAKNIDEFTVTPLNQQKLQTSLENILYTLIDDVEKLMEERTSGAFSGVKKWVANLAVDMNELRDSVPAFSREILIELQRPETKKGLTDFLVSKLDEFTASTYSEDRMEVLQQVLRKYDCISKEECREVLLQRLDRKNESINLRVMLILGLVIAAFLITLLPRGTLTPFRATMLTLGCLCLLLGGIITPMIELEAKIDMLAFKLLGERMIFEDNVIFFQSKSITDMVHILMKEGSIQMIFVGGLIFTFSVIFPSAKLISSLIYAFDFRKLRTHSVIRFFVLKSGKWSMADVMVVAIFMAYIGFNGSLKASWTASVTLRNPWK